MPRIRPGLARKKESLQGKARQMRISGEGYGMGWAHADSWLCGARRNACYGSAEVSFPVLLPLLAQMPPQLLGPGPLLLGQVSVHFRWLNRAICGTFIVLSTQYY